MPNLLLAAILASPLACVTPERPGQIPEARAQHGGSGWMVGTPVDAKVTIEPNHVTIDAAQGTWWVDVKWMAAANGPAMDLPAQLCVGDSCDTIVWDRTVQPTENTWAVSGLCSRKEKGLWMIAVVEQHGDRALVTGLLAERNRTTFEDAWTLFVTSALTLAAGDKPLETRASKQVRLDLRELVSSGAIGHLQVPGGGELSPLTHMGLADVYKKRRTVAPPIPFVPAG